MKLATFKTVARGIKFYDVREVTVGQTFCCILEPSNPFDSDCIALFVNAGRMLGHLAKEAASYLAPLLQTKDLKACG